MHIIETSCGRVRGASRHGASVFLGVRYAAPPVGDLRFAAPRPPSPWHEVADATRPAPRAMQSPEMPGRASSGETVTRSDSEDCLWLNVHTPAADAARRPVMVWFHGGGLAWGSANDHDPTTLAVDNDVVVITVSYRLGLLGFADLRPCGAEHAGSASNGFRDQIAALRWVRDNVAAFGGDPENVTIFGQSGGGVSVFALLAAPEAAGLFHRAIAHSPGVPRTVAPEVVGPLCAVLDVQPPALVARLRSLPAESIVALQQQIGFTSGGSIDGTVVTDLPAEAIRRRGAGAVPVMTGTTRDEGTFLTEMLGSQGDDVLDVVAYSLATDTLNGGSPDEYLGRLRAAHVAADARTLHTIVWTDHFRRAAIGVAEAATEAGVGGWLYRFDLEPDRDSGRALGATHACDLPFIFGDPTADVLDLYDWTSARNRAFASRWSRLLASFARHGRPPRDPDGLPDWPPYGEDRVSLIVDDTPRTARDVDIDSQRRWCDR